jgi:hypothetical protein
VGFPDGKALREQTESVRIGFIDTELEIAVVFVRLAETAARLERRRFIDPARLMAQARAALTVAAGFVDRVLTPCELARLRQKHANAERAFEAAETSLKNDEDAAGS